MLLKVFKVRSDGPNSARAGALIRLIVFSNRFTSCLGTGRTVGGSYSVPIVFYSGYEEMVVLENSFIVC